MLGGGTVPVMKVVKASATTWAKGAAIIATSGLAVEATDGPTTGTLLGFAAEAALDGQTTALIWPGLPNIVFQGRLATGDAGGAYTSLVTDRYVKGYGVSLDSTTAWYINVADTTDDIVMITDFVDAIGTSLALVEFVVIDSVFNAV
jgi:hypothetical protein